MKLLLPFLLLTTLASAQIDPIVNIPDANFKAKLLEASPGNTTASTETPDANYSVTSYAVIDTNSDGEIQESEAAVIKYLNLPSNEISDLTGISSFSNLERLECNRNYLRSLDVSGLTSLTYLACIDNQLTSIDVNGLTNLNVLYCSINQLISIDVSGLTNLNVLACGGNQLTNLDLSGLTNLNGLSCGDNQLTNLDVSGLTNLDGLECGRNQLTNLDVTGLTNLNGLDCSINQLTSLDVAGLTNLNELDCSINELTSLDVAGLTNLNELDCSSNNLWSLDVSGLTSLNTLDCSVNLLNSIDVSGLTSLNWLHCSFNYYLTSIDLSGLTNLNGLNCGGNQLTSLDVTGLTNLNYLDCAFNFRLQSLFMKNVALSSLEFDSNPELSYICASEKDLELINNKVSDYGYTNCVVNSYCSFTPEGEYYSITGNTLLDANNNGCDIDDLALPNLKYSLTDGATTGSVIANVSGGYSLPVSEGNHTITPQLENPEYFTVSPTSTTISFPAETSPFTQNFCVTPNGVKNDLELTIVPIDAARPGFDADYKIIYKNKGNTVRSGTVTLTFNDAVLDFVSANPTATEEPNGLTWTFIDLKPLENGEILLSFNLNSPMETPALNGDDVLAYTATVNSNTDDIEETPEDNTFTLNQTVVNSYDPNDKICLEGDTITPEMVGQYVHYRIRFENTGTADAINIVVKDIIDTSMFDINTLTTTDGSHEFVTRISNTNVIEFIFENINLPFDDATNDGYLVFKIKTHPTLILGDILKNNAEIYFDYNFPIITNEYKTTVQNKPPIKGESEFKGELAAYPNPVKDVLRIDTKAKVLKLEVFDMAGRKVSVHTVNNNQANLRHLDTGSYIAKIYTVSGVKQIKLLKE